MRQVRSLGSAPGPVCWAYRLEVAYMAQKTDYQQLGQLTFCDHPFWWASRLPALQKSSRLMPSSRLICLPFADNSLAPAPSGIEDLREKGELQKAYYSFLHAITSSSLSHVLLQTPSEALHQALGALVAGGAGHIDPGIRKTCLQVWATAVALLCKWDKQESPIFDEVCCDEQGNCLKASDHRCVTQQHKTKHS